jgi:glycosyltransferase involved in cell wall biosynthesis
VLTKPFGQSEDGFRFDLMRVLHVVQGYAPAIGGTERVIQKVSEQLVARHGDSVTVYTTTAYNCELFWRNDQPQLPAGTEIINGVTVRRFPVFNRFGGPRQFLAQAAYRFHLPYNDWLRALYNGPIVPGMADAIEQSGADVVAASSFPLLHMHYALRGAQRTRTPVVFYGGIHAADAFGFDRPMIYRAIQQADAYVAYTSFEANYLVEKGVSANKIYIVGVGVDVEPFEHADGSRLRRRFGWGDAPVVAFVGQQVPHKGIDMVMEAMRQIWRYHPETCLLIAGARTTYSDLIEQWTKQLPPELQARVAVMDNFPEEEKADVFAACDMLAFPSGYESFGIVFLEAWAAGKPVIGTRVGAVLTVVDEGKDGILIRHRNVQDLIDAIRTLLYKPELGRRLGAKGQQKVLQRYTWDVVVDKFRDAYIDAVNVQV